MSTKSRRKSRSTATKPLIIIILLAIVVIAAMVLIFKPGDKEPEGSISSDENGLVQLADGSTYKKLLNESSLPDATMPVQTSNETGDTVISLSGSTATVEGSGASYDEDARTLMINRAGVYQLSGSLDNGRVLVNASGEDVVLILNGVNITNSDGPALYVFKAKTVTLIANGESENIFTDGTSYDFSLDYCDTLNSEPNAAVFSKADMIIRGTGTITVNGKYSAGIICKDTLKIVNTNVKVDAVNNGINGKDFLVIQNSTVTVNAGNDGLRSTKDDDPTLGYGQFTDSNITVTSGGDGIQVETGLTVDNCSMNFVCGGGSSNDAVDSQKGIKCNQGYVSILSGNIIIDSADDSINAAGNVTVSGGVLNLSTSDDAIHSDFSLNITGGTTVVTKCKEGLEGISVDVSGGNVYINSKKDGINAAGGSDNEGFDGTAASVPSGEPVFIRVSGGYVYITSDGDGIDSNGDVILSGGTLIMYAAPSTEYGLIDHAGSFTLDGGTLLALGSSKNAPIYDGFTQNCIVADFTGGVAADEVIGISSASASYVFKNAKQVSYMIFSSPIIQTGAECTVSYGGKNSSVDNIDGVYTNPKYSGGEKLTQGVSGALTAFTIQ